MDPFHEPATANTSALSLVPHSALLVDETSASTALGKQDDSFDILSSFDASQSTHAHDCTALVCLADSTWRSQCLPLAHHVNVQEDLHLVHSAEGVAQNVGSESANDALIAAATDTKVRHGNPFLSSMNIFSWDVCHPRTCSLTRSRRNSDRALIHFFLDQRTNNGPERNIPCLHNLIHHLLHHPLHH